MIKKLPQVLRGFAVYFNGQRDLSSTCDTFVLPKNEGVFEELNAGGFTRALQILVDSSADFTVGFTLKGLDIDLLTMTSCKHNSENIAIWGSLSDGDSCKEYQFKCLFWGQLKESSSGDSQKGKLGETTAIFNVSKAEYQIEGKEVYFEEIEAGIKRVNGVDVLAERRQNLGGK